MEYLIQPWKHQLTAIERAAPVHDFALFFEMGAGKTMTAINILRHKMASCASGRMRILVFCPGLVVPNWKAEFLMHSKLKEHEITCLEGPGKKRAAEFVKKALRPEFAPDLRAPHVFIMNYESLLMTDLYDEMRAWQPEAIVFDESHLLKNYKARRAKLAGLLADSPPVRPNVYILSGSPVLNSPMDLFHPFRIMDGGKTFGANFFVFRARFFYDKNAGMPSQRYFPDWQVRPGALEEINAKIMKAGMRVTKAECLDLPEETSVTIGCSMTREQTKAYDDMKRDLVTFIRDNPASVTLAITKALRLMQITSGHLPLDPVDGERSVVRFKDTDKREKLKELLAELTPNYKVLVWAVFKDNYAEIREVCHELKIGFAEIHGEAEGNHHSNMEKFKSDPSLRVLIGNPRSGGIGVNLICAPYSIFYSRNFSLAEWLQARARNHRGGQTEKVTHFDLICTGTIDELAQKRLANKQDMSESLLASISTLGDPT